MARSYDSRKTPGGPPESHKFTRGAQRKVVGRVTPGDHEEVSREIERLWDKIVHLRRNVDAGTGGGGGGASGFIGLWMSQAFPVGTGPAGGVWRVPYLDGASITVTVERLLLRAETAPVSGTYTCRFEKSAGGSTFTGTSMGSCSITSADQEDENTSPSSATLTSGQLIRIYFTAVGSGARTMTAQLEGSIS